jgi:hypothetical protein
LRHIPRSEYLKRRTYWLEWRKAQGFEDPDADGIHRSSTNTLEADAIVVE